MGKFTKGILAIAITLLVFLIAPAGAEKKAEKKDEKPAEAAAIGEVVCEADVMFIWKRTPPQQTKLSEQGKQTPVEPDPAILEPIEEHYTRVGETGFSEEDTKNKVATSIAPAEIQARRACEELHQEESSCIARKLRTNQSNLHILDYASRTALRKSIEKDCVANKGICFATKASPVICYTAATKEQGAGEATAGGAPKEEDKKKGAKK